MPDLFFALFSKNHRFNSSQENSVGPIFVTLSKINFNCAALEFFICLSESVSSFSIDSIERAKTNFELLSEHGLVNALVELMQNAEQFMG